MGTLALISLGSNLGDRQAQLDAAVVSLRETTGIAVQAVSSYRETPPVGGPSGQGPFLNAAAALDTRLDPLDLLRTLQAIENQAGRVRTVSWGERSLDLDIVFYGDRFIDTGPLFNRVFGGVSTQLRVPHPRMAVRRFVLAPLAEIAPGFVDPLTGRSVAGLLGNLDRRPSYLAIHDPSWLFGDWLFKALIKEGTSEPLERQKTIRRLRIRYEHNECKGGSFTLRPDFEALFKQLCQELDVERWPVQRWGDRWIVSDFWFDDIGRLILSAANHGPELQDQFLEARGRVLAPTFVVAPLGWAKSLSRLPGGFFRPPLGDVPVLEVDPEDSDQAALEVQAACAATRAG
jgi:2-amino-4-hydroxy-6-hydroxymethyldihydropteridine diphosphokinase